MRNIILPRIDNHRNISRKFGLCLTEQYEIYNHNRGCSLVGKIAKSVGNVDRVAGARRSFPCRSECLCEDPAIQNGTVPRFKKGIRRSASEKALLKDRCRSFWYFIPEFLWSYLKFLFISLFMNDNRNPAYVAFVIFFINSLISRNKRKARPLRGSSAAPRGDRGERGGN